MDHDAATAAFALTQSPPLEGTASAKNAIAQVSYTHDAMIDLVLVNPKISQNDIAKHFGYSVPWVSRVMNSDAFLARLAQRKHDIIDPAIFATVDEKIRALAQQSLDKVLEYVAKPNCTFDQAMEGANLAVKALGYGARQQNVAVQQNFVVAMPPKAESSQAWEAKYAPKPVEVIDVEPNPGA